MLQPVTISPVGVRSAAPTLKLREGRVGQLAGVARAARSSSKRQRAGRRGAAARVFLTCLDGAPRR